MKETADKIHEYGVVPVVVINDAKDAGMLADVLCEEYVPYSRCEGCDSYDGG